MFLPVSELRLLEFSLFLILVNILVSKVIPLNERNFRIIWFRSMIFTVINVARNDTIIWLVTRFGSYRITG